MQAHPPAYYQSCSIAQASAISRAVDDAVVLARKGMDASQANPQYRKWFGTGSAQHVREVYGNAYINLVSMSLTFDCECYIPIYAYVNAYRPFVIHICPSFWYPRVDKYDTQAGTIIHEMTHFTVVGGTNDYAGGPDEAILLAMLDSKLATENADTYEYYVEDQP